MQASEALIAATKQFEGFRAVAYWDAIGKVYTIGYGTTTGVTEGQTVTMQEADLDLRADMAQLAADLQNNCTVVLSQPQVDALLDGAYNCGIEFITPKDSHLMRYINAGDFGNAANEFPLWCHSGNKIIPDLYVRRKAEQSWFLGTDPVAYPSESQQQEWLKGMTL